MDPSQAKPIVTPMPSAPTGTPETPKTAPVADNTPQPTQEPVSQPSTAPQPTAPVATDPAPEILDLTPSVTETGNNAFDTVGKLLKAKGVTGIDAAFKEIAETGEVSFTLQAKIVEALGEDMAPLAMQQLTSEVAKIKQEKTATTTRTLGYAAEKFGVEAGNEQALWGDIQTFVRSAEAGFTAADRQAMTKMIQAGGLQAEMVLDRIHARFQQTQGFEQPADLLQGDTYAPTAFVPVSNKEYAAEMRKIVAEHGYNSHQAESLRQRRMASQSRGY